MNPLQRRADLTTDPLGVDLPQPKLCDVGREVAEYYQVDKVQDVFQFGIVVFFCLLGVLPWQKADRADPNFQEFCAWRDKRSSKVNL